MPYELVPPGNHRRNIAERAIQTAKNHFVAVLCGSHHDFPMQLWWRLLTQAEWQMNMIGQSNVAPNVSEYAHIHGQCDYMRHPWAPVGCPFQVQNIEDKRKNWDKHTTSGWHLVTSMEHYWCFRKYITKARVERVSDTVFFKHKYLTQPTITPEDTVTTAAKELNNTILGTVPQEHAQYNALKNISDMFSMIAAQKAEAKPRQSGRIKQHNESKYPRVEKAKIPR